MPEMFTDDDSARQALRTLNDDPAPPVATSLDQVLRRGRRRVFVQRTGMVAGVVAVVAAIGVTTVLLRSPGGPGDGGDRVQVAATTPATPAALLPGWETVPVDEVICKQNPLRTPPGKPPVALLPMHVVEPAFTAAVDEVVEPTMILSQLNWEEHSPKADGPRGYLSGEVPMDNGNGQLQLEAEVFPGTPAQMADASSYAYGDCKTPSRRTLADGTVMQLFQADHRDAERPSQHLQVFRPDGRVYILTAAGWSKQDLVPVAGGGHTIKGGRGKLPVTEAQLAEIAENMVTRLG